MNPTEQTTPLNGDRAVAMYEAIQAIFYGVPNLPRDEYQDFFIKPDSALSEDLKGDSRREKVLLAVRCARAAFGDEDSMEALKAEGHEANRLEGIAFRARSKLTLAYLLEIDEATSNPLFRAQMQEALGTARYDADEPMPTPTFTDPTQTL